MNDRPASSSAEAPPFEVGDHVIKRTDPNLIGEVMKAPELDGPDWWVSVRFGASQKEYVSTTLELADEKASVEDLTREGKWGTFEALRRAVAVERILRSSPSTVYAFNAQRIQLYPHQYKPLLKILENDDRRLLVADEVGLGKTIEAGLVLAELEARGALSRVLVICPSRLREKWRDEMERKFGQEFDIWGADEVRNYVSKVQRTPERTSFRAVISFQSLRRDQLLEQFLSVLPGLDLVIFDEAHHARNRATATFRMAKEVSQIADGMLLLTATPLHLGRGDLYSMLNLLREDEFKDEDAFVQSVARNEGVVLAQTIARRRNRAELPKAAREIRGAYGIGSGSQAEDPLLQEVLVALEGPAPSTHEGWLDLERLLERAHVLSHVFTRTKKRDAYESIPERSPVWVQVQWTREEHLTYCALAGLDPDKSDAEQYFDLGSIQRARQAASSIHGTLLHKRRLVDSESKSEFEQCDLEDLDGVDGFDLLDMPLPARDSKYEKFHEALMGLLLEHPNRKVMVFTFFVGTSRYLADKLNDAGIKALRIAGDVPSNPRRPEIDERSKVITAFKEDPSIRVLVSTEVGSEGLDFQFCSCLVNYDLPWNPMVVEQRIGRIDRLGQKADVLHIVSLAVESTVEDRILERLYKRIGICERSIGDLESILGEGLSQIRRSFYSGKLTAAQLERRVADTEKVLVKRVQDLKQLEVTASNLLGHEDYIRDEISKIQKLGRYLTGSQIRSVIDGYLEDKHADVRVIEEGGGVLKIRMTPTLLRAIDEVMDGKADGLLALRHRTRRGYLRATTNGELAYDDAQLDILNASHPLVRTAAASFRRILDQPQARIGSVRLREARLDPGDGFQRGTYFLALFPIDLTNPSTRSSGKRLLEVIAIPQDGCDPLGAEAAERLLHLCLEEGEPAPSIGSLAPMTDSVWRAMRSEARRRVRVREVRENQDNASMYTRRKQRLLDERDRKIASARKRLQTLEERERGARMLDLARASIESIKVRYEQGLDALEGRGSCEASMESDPAMCCCLVID